MPLEKQTKQQNANKNKRNKTTKNTETQKIWERSEIGNVSQQMNKKTNMEYCQIN